MKKILLSSLAVCLLLPACAGGALPGEAVAEAATLARDQGSARVFMRMTNSMSSGEFQMEGEGELDFARQLGHMTLHPTGAAQQGAASMLGEMEMVFADFVAYLRMDGFEQFMPEGKRWIKIDFKAVGEDLGIDFSQLQQLGQGDPGQQLDYLKGATNIENAGSEEIRGVDTTHFTATLDFGKVAAEFPDAAESIERIQELSGIETAPMEVWLDADGLPRRVTYSFDIDPQASASPAPPPSSQTILMEYFDSGADVNVEIPPASETLDPSQLQA